MKGQVVFRVRGVEAQSEMRVRGIYHFPEDLRVWWISLSSISKHSDLTNPTASWKEARHLGISEPAELGVTSNHCCFFYSLNLSRRRCLLDRALMPSGWSPWESEHHTQSSLSLVATIMLR